MEVGTLVSSSFRFAGRLFLEGLLDFLLSLFYMRFYLLSPSIPVISFVSSCLSFCCFLLNLLFSNLSSLSTALVARHIIGAYLATPVVLRRGMCNWTPPNSSRPAVTIGAFTRSKITLCSRGTHLGYFVAIAHYHFDFLSKILCCVCWFTRGILIVSYPLYLKTIPRSATWGCAT